MKAAVFERQQGNIDVALTTVNTALTKYPKFAKFYMIKGQIEHSKGDIPAARATYAAGIKASPKDVRLWILASRLEEADGKRTMARALLNKARLANRADELLWAEAVELEERAEAPNQAKTNLAKGKSLEVFYQTKYSTSLQRFRIAPPPGFCGLWRSWPKHARYDVENRLMPSRKSATKTHLFSARQRDCSGRRGRLRRPVIGLLVR
jgi:tetratricopeptide (TPR) repeat protein